MSTYRGYTVPNIPVKFENYTEQDWYEVMKKEAEKCCKEEYKQCESTDSREDITSWINSNKTSSVIQNKEHKRYESTIHFVTVTNEDEVTEVRMISKVPIIINLDREFSIEQMDGESEEKVKCYFFNKFVNEDELSVEVKPNIRQVFDNDNFDSGVTDLMDELDVDDAIADFFDSLVEEIEDKLSTALPFNLFDWELKEIKEYYMPILLKERDKVLKEKMEKGK